MVGWLVGWLRQGCGVYFYVQLDTILHHAFNDFTNMYGSNRIIIYPLHTLFLTHAQLAHWVRGIRERKALLLRKGIDVEITPETVGPGVPLPAKAITAERMEKLDSIGFAWVVTGPRTAWDDRFRELVEFYEEHGKYPSQSMGSVGQVSVSVSAVLVIISCMHCFCVVHDISCVCTCALFQWVHKQRRAYARGDVNYMKYKAPKVRMMRMR